MYHSIVFQTNILKNLFNVYLVKEEKVVFYDTNGIANLNSEYTLDSSQEIFQNMRNRKKKKSSFISFYLKIFGKTFPASL